MQYNVWTESLKRIDPKERFVSESDIRENLEAEVVSLFQFFFLLHITRHYHKTVRGQRLYLVFHGKESCHTITPWLLIRGKECFKTYYWKNKTNHENRTSAYGDNMVLYNVTFLNLFGSRYIFWDKHLDFWLLGNTQCAKISINFLSKEFNHWLNFWLEQNKIDFIKVKQD